MTPRIARFPVISAFLLGTILTSVAALAATPGQTVRIEPPPVVPIEPPPIQGPKPAPAAAAKPPFIPLRVQITISRWENEKKTSSLPFTLWVNANDAQGTRVTIGQNVPIPQSTFVPQKEGGVATTPMTSFSYQNVGTNIVATANRLDDGRFLVNLQISDSSVVPAKGPTGAVSMTSLQTNNALPLRDGQTAEFLAATDKVTGEVTKIEVSIAVLK